MNMHSAQQDVLDVEAMTTRFPVVFEHAIIHAWRGSVAHGTYVPSDDPLSVDDLDTIAVVVPPREHYTGLAPFGSRGTVEIKDDPWDVVAYEARKTVELLGKGNPNVLSLLWMEEEDYISRTAAGRYLIDHREVFVGKHVHAHFVGYAHSQLSKLERGEHRGYMGERRKALVDRFGYDPKNASHLIRLLRQGVEFLRTGELVVRRPDAAELVAIKRGEWPLEQVKAEARYLFGLADVAAAKSSLPERPDRDRVSRLCDEVVWLTLRGRDEL